MERRLRVKSGVENLQVHKFLSINFRWEFAVENKTGNNIPNREKIIKTFQHHILIPKDINIL